MTLDFSKYKTYDTSNGYGNKDQWKSTIEEVFDRKLNDSEKLYQDELFEKAFGSEFEDTMGFQINKEGEIKKSKKQGLKYCKSLEELKKEFKKLMMKYHPDKAGDTKENNEITGKIIDDYNKYSKKFK